MTDLPPVQETVERMVFLVRSDTHPRRQYRVDLLANDGAGRCACTDFGTRRQPNIDAGGEPWSKACSCKHARRAAWYLLRITLKALADEESNEN
jgi:hypothetical protein